MCVQYEQSVSVSFFTRSQHCDNEFIWKYTLWAASACGRVHGGVCTYVHICTVCVHVNMAVARDAACECLGMCIHLNVCAKILGM